MSQDTNQPSQMAGLNGYTVDPFFTVGETIGGYTPIGILDGTGAYKLDNDTVRILVNHEVSSNLGYTYTLESGVSLTGARVSYFDLNIQTLAIEASGLAFDAIYNRAGNMVDANNALDTVEAPVGLDRFCAANLFAAGEYGFVDTIFFTGEETDGGTEFALDTANNALYALPWLGVAAWESVTALETGTEDKIALLIGDDRETAPLYLYVGTKGVDYNTDGTIDFLERNGLTGGDLFVWVSNNATEVDPRDFAGTGNTTTGSFVEIEVYSENGPKAVDGDDEGNSIQDELGYDALGFATQAQQDALAIEVNAFRFSRPEDVATNPNDGTQAVLASTGRTGIFDDADVWGTTYIVDVDFTNIATKTIDAELNILYDGNDEGNEDFGLRSPDNLDWADNGLIYLQEDRAISADLWGATSGEEASIWTIDPADANPESTLTRVGQIDRTAVPAGQTDTNPTDLGNWESSGILDVSTLFGNQPGEMLLFNVQAHSLRDGAIGSSTVEGTDPSSDDRNLVQGGQLSFLITPTADIKQDQAMVVPTGDDVRGGIDFDGTNDLVFTGAGNDEVDSTLAGASAGANRIFTGSDNDVIYLAHQDRVFAGTGDDTFYLGTAGRAIGGQGNDTFYANEGGDNLLSGGAGSDAFWITTGELPSANTILDFTKGEDVIGVAGQGANFGFDDLGFSGNDILIGDKAIATLIGVDTNTLTAEDFAF